MFSQQVLAAGGIGLKRGIVIFVLAISTISGCSAADPPEQHQYSEKVNQQASKQISVAELESKIIEQAEQMLNKQYYFTYKQATVETSLRDLGATTNVNKVVEEVRRNSGSTVDNLKLSLDLDEKTAAEKLKALTQEFNAQAVDATYKVKPDNTMEITPHTVGKEVNVPKAIEDLEEALPKNETTIVLEVKETAPQVKTENIEGLKLEGMVASFSTNYPVDNIPRTENLKRATAALDMKVLKPGQVLSFNTTVGPRTEATGYKEALIIIENEYVPGVGGGICQVSSTLYNVALLADLEIVERHQHEFTIPYLPPGRDATVVYDQADLRFKNNTPGLLLIRTQAKGGVLTMSMYGKKSNKQVEIKTEIEETKPFETEQRYDPSLAPGKTKTEQGGVKGYKSTTYRIVKVDNKEVKKEQISKDVYKPANKIIKFGKKSRGQSIE
jgi:vancomycin resistance protein YoaR